MENTELPVLSLVVTSEQTLYTHYNPEPDFSEFLKKYLKSKIALKEYKNGVNLTVISEKPLDEDKFRTAVSNWIRDEKVLFKTAEKLTIYSLIGLLVFGSVMLILSLTLSEYNDVLKYSLLPIIGSISLSKAAGILCFEMPAMTAQKLRFNKMEKYNVITFVYDNDCKKEQPAPLCSEDMVK